MMKLKVRKMEISTGDVRIALLNEDDAEKLDLFRGDRIKIRSNKNETIAVVDTTASNKLVPKKSIGLFTETAQNIKIKNGERVYVTLTKICILYQEKTEGRNSEL
jgi:anaerobic selenocysteine-containing dehydrogenase